MDLRTGSSDSIISRHESSSFEIVQRRSNESQYGRKKASCVERELEEKGITFFLRKIRVTDTQGEPERKIEKGSDHRAPKRALSSNYNTNDLKKFRKRGRTEETVMPCTSGCNLRPRNGRRMESRPTMEMKTQQGGPVRARKSRRKHYRAPTSKSKQDQATRIPDEEVINNKRTRKGKEERIPTDQSPRRF
ncbi:uncharacterized protein TNCV_1415831 [Trichonephila clavipes]|nr:uncharacterized protein TNCV_1415831 [Trichonephila clavipes]